MPDEVIMNRAIRLLKGSGLLILSVILASEARAGQDANPSKPNMPYILLSALHMLVSSAA
jgi:hypothetical protein